MSRQVLAAGGVLWKDDGGRLTVAVVHRPKYDDWSLPKGKLEPGEAAVVGALREVCEETGFAAHAGRTLGRSTYRVLDAGRDVPKTVRWWSMRARDGAFTPSGEVDGLDWLDVPAALRRLSGGHGTSALEAFVEQPPRTATVLLLRHASAGRQQDWKGPDSERPLDQAGFAQAQLVAQLLVAYGPDRVLSAPPVRCVQTAQPLAARIGRAVELDPDLAESSAGRLAPRIRSVAEPGGCVLLCSQGGVVPQAVQQLAADSALALGDEVPAGKGSLWALSLHDGQLIDADYTPAPRASD